MKFHIKTVCRTIPADLLTPVGIYLRVRDMYPQSVLLESSDYHTSQNSFSFIGVCPSAHFTVAQEKVSYTYPDGGRTEIQVDSSVDVPELLGRYIRSYDVDGNPAGVNGFFGYTAYDAVRYFERVAIQPREDEFAGVPDMMYVLFRYVIIVNHFKNQVTIVENLSGDQESGMDELISVLSNQNVPQYGFRVCGEPSSPLTDGQYIDMVRQGVEHTRRGDVFQIVLSRRYGRAFSGDDFNVYRALRCVNPSPYLFYFDMGSFRIFGSSPETHLRVQDGRAYIDPIAGTFRRTGDDARDAKLAGELLEDPKENAEHIMLVDLARNDLSRNCRNVKMEYLRQIQYYSHVIHMVSRVGADLMPGADTIRLFADTFPAGTLSGAPKVRAMQLIDGIEPHSRVVYGGSIGYLGFDGSLNQAITIRSFLSVGGRLYCQAGAGIVAGSQPENELKEIGNKLGALMKAVEYAETFSR